MYEAKEASAPLTERHQVNTITLDAKQIQDLRFFLLTWDTKKSKSVSEEGRQLMREQAFELYQAIKEQEAN